MALACTPKTLRTGFKDLVKKPQAPVFIQYEFFVKSFAKRQAQGFQPKLDFQHES